MPGTVVWRSASTCAPEVTRSIWAPVPFVSSFSGMRPTESRSVSQGTKRAVSILGARVAGSTSAIVTPSTRSLPWMSTTVVLKCRGMPLSSRHCTMLRFSPLE